MPEYDYDVCVIGGGIAGLVAAYELRDLRIVLFEATDRVGGRMRSEPRGDYWLNLGAHLIAGPGSLMYRLTEDAGIEARVAPGSATAIHMNGKTISGGRAELYPFRLSMPLAAQLSFIRAGLKIRRMLAAYYAAYQSREGGAAAASRLRHLSFLGDTSFAHFMGTMHPDVAALFGIAIQRATCTMDQVSAGAGLGIFAHVWSKGSDLNRNLIGGSAELPKAIARRLGERVVIGARAESVTQSSEGVNVRVNVGGVSQEISARASIVATPAHVTKDLVTTLPDDTKHALGEIHYGPYIVGGILTKETRPMPWDNLYAIATPGRAFIIIFNHANVIRARETERKPGGALMVYADLGRKIWDRSDDEIKDPFTREIYSIYPESTGVVDEVVIQRWEKGYPYVRPGRHRVQPALEKSLGNVFLAGDYLDEALMETAAATGVEAARSACRLLEGDVRMLAVGSC